jgi:hypothetical protein
VERGSSRPTGQIKIYLQGPLHQWNQLLLRGRVSSVRLLYGGYAAAGAECTEHQAGDKPGDAGNVVFGMVRPALNRFAGATQLPFGIVRVVLVDAIDDFLQSQMGHGPLSERSEVSVFDSVLDCNTVNSRGICRCTIEPGPTAEKTLLGWATKATWSPLRVATLVALGTRRVFLFPCPWDG